MKKISIVCEKNEENNTYVIKNLFIFDENQAPRKIDYEGAQDLLSVVRFAEVNGFNLFEGLKPAMDAGLIQIISKSNKKAMEELEALYLAEQIKYAPRKTEEELMKEAVDKDLDKLNQEKQASTTMTPEKEKKIRKKLPKEFQDLVDYFKYDMAVRALSNETTEEEIMDKYNLPKDERIKVKQNEIDERIVGLEQARKNVILAYARLNALPFNQPDTDEAKLARIQLKDRQEEFERIHSTYRAQLAEALKAAKESNTPLAPEYRNLLKYFKLDILRASDNERIRGLEDAKARVIVANEKLKSITDPNSPEAELARIQLKDRQEEFERIRSKYRADLAEAIRKAETEETETKNKLDLPEEDRELAEYLKLNIVRANKIPNREPITKEGLARIEELKAKNERVAALEKARQNLIAAIDKEAGITDKNSPSGILARRDVKDRQKDYDKLHAAYRAQLAEAIKNAKVIQEQKVKTLKNEGTVNKNNGDVPPKKPGGSDNPGTPRDNNSIPVDTTPPKKPDDSSSAKKPEDDATKENTGDKQPPKKVGDTTKENSSKTNNGGGGSNPPKKADDTANKEDDSTKKKAGVVEKIKKLVGLPPRKTVKKTAKPEPTKEKEGVAKDNNSIPAGVTPETEEKKPADKFFVSDEELKATVNNSGATQQPKKPADKFFVTDEELKATVNNSGATQQPKKPADPAKTNNGGGGSNPPKKDDNGTNKPNARLVNDGKAKQAKGINVKPSDTVDVELQDENGNKYKGTIKSTNKLKRFLKGVGIFIAGIVVGTLAHLGLVKPKKLIPSTEETTTNVDVKPIVTETTTPITETTIKNADPTKTTDTTDTTKTTETTETTETHVVTNVNINSVLMEYFNKYNVPQNTRLFLQRPEVMTFLSQYKNPDQLREVISALSYGYEANILTTKSGNFRIAADGQNLLSSFTRDFLCAKAVVNNYSPKQMLTAFGGTDITYEDLMDGFKSYCYTITTYGMNATEPLPFQYLTNGNPNNTPVLNDLQQKLIKVNTNRMNGTLTSEHTDDFISTVFNIYVAGDQSLNMTEGAKTVGAALVSSYTAMQAQVDNGEALYLHQDHGAAKAGINLVDVNGHFEVNYPDQTHYEFSNLYDVMNHEYGDVNETAARCVQQQTVLLNNITAMYTMAPTSTSSASTAKENLAQALINSNYEMYGNMVRSEKGELSQELLDRISLLNSAMNKYIKAYKTALESNDQEYVGFIDTYTGADRVLGVAGKGNDLFTLINNRRSLVTPNVNYTITRGVRYTEKAQGLVVDTTPVVTGKTTEPTQVKVTRDQLTVEEREEADRQIAGLKQQESAAQQEQQTRIDQTVTQLREGVAEGRTQEELEAIAEQGGITLDPEYQQSMQEALTEQRAGEEKRSQIEQRVEDDNRQAQEEATRRDEEEARRQREQKEAQDALIRASQEADEAEQHPEDEDHPRTPLDETDPERREEGEEAYTPTASSAKVQAEANNLVYGMFSDGSAEDSVLDEDVDTESLGGMHFGL